MSPEGKEHFDTRLNIETVLSLSDILPALERGRTAVVYEPPPLFKKNEIQSILGDDATYNVEMLNSYLRKVFNADTAGKPNLIAAHIDRCKNYLIGERGLKVAKVFEKICLDLHRTLPHLDTFVFQDLRINRGAPDNSTKPWHKDRDRPDKENSITIRLVRTYYGPSTEYALNDQGKGRTTFADAALAVHHIGEHGAWHRSPKHNLDHRLVVTLWGYKKGQVNTV